MFNKCHIFFSNNKNTQFFSFFILTINVKLVIKHQSKDKKQLLEHFTFFKKKKHSHKIT